MGDLTPDIKTFLEAEDVPFLEDVSLREYSYAKIGGTATYVVLPDSIESLRRCQAYMAKHQIETKTIGATSNILFLDDKTYGVLLSLKNLSGVSYDEEAGQVIVDAGCMLNDFVLAMADHSIEGFENLIGIPGTVGGAVYMNAGSFRCEISDHLLSVTVVTPAGEEVELPRDELALGWRHSVFQDKDLGVIARATFNCPKGDGDAIRRQMNRWQGWRDAYLESDYPNLGSIFSTKDIYRDIANQHRGYRAVLWVFRKLMSRHDRPRNCAMLAQLTAFFFGFKRRGLPYSGKTINTFVNRGNASSEEIVAYIDVLRDLIGGSVKQENEVVTSPVIGEEKES